MNHGPVLIFFLKFALAETIELREKIQTIISEACAEINTKRTGLNKNLETALDNTMFDKTSNLYGVEKNFDSLFSSIVLFLEQDVTYNVTMI